MLGHRAPTLLVGSFALFGVACNVLLGTLTDETDGGKPLDGGAHLDATVHHDAGSDAGRRAGDSARREESGRPDGGGGDSRVSREASGDAQPDGDSGALRCTGDAGGNAVAASCKGEGGPGITTCPAGTGSESCCTSLAVPCGSYHRSYNAADSGLGLATPDASMADAGGTFEGHPASVSTVRIDKYLVTVGRFRRFLEAGTPLPATGSGRHAFLPAGGLMNSAPPHTVETGWNGSWSDLVVPQGALQCAGAGQTALNTWTPDAGSQENLPIGCVNWYEAYAFCIWDGGFLPSETEWEYAAAGGSAQNDFPWGSNTPGMNNSYAIYDEYYNGNPTQIAPVGSAPLGFARWGQLDMAGEMYEWTLDYWNPSFLDPCTDCAYLPSPQLGSLPRVLKTQRFSGSAPSLSFLTPPYRTNTDPTARNYTVGFRCARNP